MPAHVVLQSWKQISEYVGRTERTLQRWEQKFGFPVHRPSGKPRSSVMALAGEIQEWARGKPSLVQIQESARLKWAKIVQHPGGDHNSGTHRIQSSSVDLSTRPTPDFVSSKKLPHVTFERVQVAGLLLEKQMKLRDDVLNLLKEQQRLCTVLERGGGRRFC